MPSVPSNPPTDQALVSAWQAGDQAAARALVHRYGTSIARFLSSKGVGGDDLDDMIQETFVKAFRGLAGWRSDGSWAGWLFSIARNLANDHYRQRVGRTKVALVEQDLVDSDNPSGEYAATEAAATIQEGLATLSPMQREVFLMRADAGMGYDAIAAALATSTGAVRVHYHNAVKRLKELLT